VRTHAFELGLRAKLRCEQAFGFEIVETLAKPDQRRVITKRSEAIGRSVVVPTVRDPDGTNKPKYYFRADTIHPNAHSAMLA